jgi:hypothetical protein
MGGMDWIDLAQDRDQWRAIVNTAMKLMLGSSWIASQLLDSQEGLSSMKLVITSGASGGPYGSEASLSLIVSVFTNHLHSSVSRG